MVEYYLEKGTTATINPPLGYSLLDINSGVTVNKQFIIIQAEKGFNYYNQQFTDALAEGVISNAEYAAIIANQGASRQVYELAASYTFDKNKLIDLIDVHGLPITTAGKTAPQLTDDIINAGYYVVFNPLFSVPSNFIPSDPPSDGIGQDFAADSTNTAILFKDIDTGAIERTENVNTLQAVGNSDGINIKIQYTGGEVAIIDKLYLNKTYINGSLVTQVLATALIELNSLFANTGGAIGKLPVITSTNVINLTEGNVLNHLITGTNLVAIEVDISTTGTVPIGAVTRPDGHPRRLIGGSTLTVGTFYVYIRGYNYFGESATQTLEIIVSSSFTNTYSAYGGLTATNKHFLVDSALTSQSSSPLFRSSNSTGYASDSTKSWSASWYQKSQATHGAWWGSGLGSQFGVGGTRQNRAWAGFDISVYGDSTKTILQVMYGSKFSYLDFKFELTGTSLNDYKHIILTYNGGDTDSTTNPYGTAGVEDCFKVYINGANVPITSAGYGNTGFSGTVNANGFSSFKKDHDLRIMLADYAPNIYHSQKLNIDEIGFYNYVLTLTQVGLIYNSGTPQSLHNITGVTNPVDYFRFGDGADPANAANTDLNQFPVMYNYYSSRFNMEAINMVVSDYVSDVP